MAQYIDKSTLVTEIKKRLKEYQESADAYYIPAKRELKEILSFIDTLEVKEVDLNTEFDKYCDNLYLIDLENEPYAELFECAKYFFNLGLKLQKGE